MAGRSRKGSEILLNEEGSTSEGVIPTKIPEKQRKVAEGGRSKRLEFYRKERDELVEQMQKDISELQSIFGDEDCNAVDRMEKRCTSTGDMRTENLETLSLRLYTCRLHSEIKQLKSKLEKERKSKEEAFSSVRSAKSEINQLTSHLEKQRMSKEEDLSSLRSAESEINQLKRQLQNERKSKEEDLFRINRMLNESDNDKVALKLNHAEDIRVHKDEIRKLQERLTIDKYYEERAKELKRKCDDLEAELSSLRSAESEIKQLKRQLENERKSTEEDLSRITIDISYEEKEKELKRKSDELEIELARLVCKNNQLINELENERKVKVDALFSLRSAESEISQLKTQLENERMSKKEDLSRLVSKTNQLINELENEKKAKEDALVWYVNYYNTLTIDKSYEEKAKELKRKCDWLETEIAIERKLKEEALQILFRYMLRSVESENNQLKKQLENERKIKEEALLRNLRDNTPNTEELSDPNRPTKFSEQFSELYDNEWMDAFDELEKLLGDKKEKEIISYLRDFVLEIHSVCNDLSFSKLKTIEEAFVKPSVPSKNTKIPTKILQAIKDGIKSMAPNLLENTREIVLAQLEKKYLHDHVARCLQHHSVKRYIDRCTEVCWYMSVQDPQLFMDGSKSPDEIFDSNKHTEYTKKGTYEEFVVWPALYLYKGGPMLSKGVAQGTKKMTGQQ
ncbi:hypothetical protein ACJMK2_030798 [Sinanodonta woodiana]|uniref:Mitochondria-eating protein C-terminal domain-containing protein n=1 Tax=Sinanodonta woodiana TaxID=1069815 RepID=A0ABD3WYW3_SINWO